MFIIIYLHLEFHLFLKNYRIEWRNKPTHDHKLFFKEQEALLAIVSVSAFIAILLDQLLEEVSYVEENETEDRKSVAENFFPNYEELDFFDKVISLLKMFSYCTWEPSIITFDTMDVTEILGMVRRYIKRIFDPSIKLKRDSIIMDDSTLRPSLLLTHGDDEVILEVKRPNFTQQDLEYANEQMRTYLQLGNFRTGVIYFAPSGERDWNADVSEMTQVIKDEYVYHNEKHIIYTLVPVIKS